MTEPGQVWQLLRDDELLADFVVTGVDFPWLNARLRPAAGFGQVRLLFEDEIRRLDLLEDPDQWEAAYRRIRDALTLRAPDGREVSEFLLRIDGNHAWWRWSDEPFPEPENEPRTP